MHLHRPGSGRRAMLRGICLNVSGAARWALLPWVLASMGASTQGTALLLFASTSFCSAEGTAADMESQGVVVEGVTKYVGIARTSQVSGLRKARAPAGTGRYTSAPLSPARSEQSLRKRRS